MIVAIFNNESLKRMNRIILLTVLCFISVMTMAQKTAINAKEGEIIITGKIGTVNPPKQIWIYIGDSSWDSLIVKDGVFEYRKKTLLPAYGAIQVKYKPYYKGVKGHSARFTDMDLKDMFFEAGHMEINSPVDTLNKYAVVSGSASALQHQHEVYWAGEGDIMRKQKKLTAEYKNATPEQLQSAEFLDAYNQQQAAILREFDSLIRWQITTYPNSIVSRISFMRYVTMTSKNSKPETAMALFELFSNEMKESEAGKKMIAWIKKVSEPREKVPVVSVGDLAPDFEQSDVSHKPVKLSDFHGHYVLVDFWASWCKPCRKVNPDLVKLYNKFKSEDFSILGVSLDKDEEKWRGAIEADKLDWYHVSDLQGWKNEVAIQYGIKGVPQNLLIDPEGKVILKNASVTELEEKLTALFL